MDEIPEDQRAAIVALVPNAALTHDFVARPELGRLYSSFVEHGCEEGTDAVSGVVLPATEYPPQARVVVDRECRSGEKLSLRLKVRDPLRHPQVEEAFAWLPRKTHGGIWSPLLLHAHSGQFARRSLRSFAKDLFRRIRDTRQGVAAKQTSLPEYNDVCSAVEVAIAGAASETTLPSYPTIQLRECADWVPTLRTLDDFGGSMRGVEFFDVTAVYGSADFAVESYLEVLTQETDALQQGQAIVAEPNGVVSAQPFPSYQYFTGLPMIVAEAEQQEECMFLVAEPWAVAAITAPAELPAAHLGVVSCPNQQPYSVSFDGLSPLVAQVDSLQKWADDWTELVSRPQAPGETYEAWSASILLDADEQQLPIAYSIFGTTTPDGATVDIAADVDAMLLDPPSSGGSGIAAGLEYLIAAIIAVAGTYILLALAAAGNVAMSADLEGSDAVGNSPDPADEDFEANKARLGNELARQAQAARQAKKEGPVDCSAQFVVTKAPAADADGNEMPDDLPDECNFDFNSITGVSIVDKVVSITVPVVNDCTEVADENPHPFAKKMVASNFFAVAKEALSAPCFDYYRSTGIAKAGIDSPCNRHCLDNVVAKFVRGLGGS